MDADGQALTYVHVATAPGVPAGAMFGESVSVAGKLVIVGASQARFAEEEFVGAAYAFAITEVGTLKFLTTLSAPQRETDDGFGKARRIDWPIALLPPPLPRLWCSPCSLTMVSPC